MGEHVAITAPQTTEANRVWRRGKLPAPSPDRLAYRLNRWIALASSPRRLVNYARYRRAKRAPDLHYLPVKLDVENVSRCNFHCTMCQVSDWPGYQRAADMSLEDFKRLIDSQYGVVEMKLQGVGEPLLGGETYFAMIRYARSKRIWVRTTTNASLLHLNDNYKKLIDSGINDVQISIDGATKATFEQIRRGSRFERVVENCKLINAYASKRQALVTRTWVVLQRDNFQEFFDFITLAHEMGFKRLTFALNLTDWGQQTWNDANRGVTVEDAVTPEMAEEAVARGRGLGVEVTFWNITSKYQTDKPEHLCPWPFERSYISSDMRIVPCCMIGNPDVSELGDARDFTDAWRGKTYQQFRQAHLDGQLPKICQGCYYAKGEAPA